MALLSAAALLIFNINRGFELTDESYYLLCAINPQTSLSPGTQFGSYTHGLFLLGAENIAAFRLIGLLFLFGAGLAFAGSFEDFFSPEKKSAETAPGKTGRIAVILLGVFAYYAPWILTPSYNWLNLLCVLFALTALLRYAKISKCLRMPSLKILLWGALLGFSCSMAFVARPATAAAIALLSLIWIFAVSPPEHRRPFLFAAFFSGILFFLFHILAVEGGFTSYTKKLLSGLELNRYFKVYTLTAIAKKTFSDIFSFPLRFLKTGGGFIAGLFIFKVLFLRNKIPERYRNRLETLSYFIFWILLLLQTRWEGGQKTAWGLGFTGVAFFTGIAWLRSIFSGKNTELRKDAGQKLLPFILLGSCASFALSSDNGLFRQMSFAFGLLTAASLAIVPGSDSPENNGKKSRYICLLLSVTLLLVFQNSYRHPYRLGTSISRQTEWIGLRSAKGRLRVDSRTKQYVEDLLRASSEAGWQEKTPLIDLTENPGAAVILNAFTPGTPWLFGQRYSGFTKAALEMADPKQLQKAWILTTPEDIPQKTPDIVLRELGLPFPENYRVIGRFRTSFRNQEQMLWKPADKD